MKNILLRGYYGFGNAGDDALLQTILKSIESFDRNITIISKNPLPLNLMKKNKNVELNNINLVKAMFINDVVIYGGGSQLQDFGTFKNFLTLLRSLILNWIMKLRNKKVVYLGISIGPISSLRGKYLVKKIMKSCDLVIVRDQESFDFLMNISEDLSKYMLSPDLVLSFERDRKLAYIKEENIQKTLGINLMPHYSEIKKDEKVEKIFMNNIVALIKENPEIKIKFFQFQNKSIMNDERTYEKLKKHIAVQNIKVKVEFIKYKNIENLVSEMRNCNFFIGMRLHSAVLCDVLKIPHIMLSYHPKGIGYAQYLGYKESMVVNCDSENQYSTKLQKLIDKPEDFLVNESVIASRTVIKSSFYKVNKLIEK